jgi:hypothetical protein
MVFILVDGYFCKNAPLTVYVFGHFLWGISSTPLNVISGFSFHLQPGLDFY